MDQNVIIENVDEAISIWNQILEIIKPKFTTQGKYEKYFLPLIPISLSKNNLYLSYSKGFDMCGFHYAYGKIVTGILNDILKSEKKMYISLEKDWEDYIW